MSNPASVPVVDIEIFPNVSRSFLFTCNRHELDGTLIGPYDLTNKTVVATLTDVFSTDLVLTSGEDPSDEGSSVEIVDAPTDGKFRFYLSADETDRAKELVGYWRIVLIEANVDDIVVLRGSINVVPFNAEGEL